MQEGIEVVYMDCVVHHHTRCAYLKNSNCTGYKGKTSAMEGSSPFNDKIDIISLISHN
jgi:hypothetical protein